MAHAEICPVCKGDCIDEPCHGCESYGWVIVRDDDYYELKKQQKYHIGSPRNHFGSTPNVDPNYIDYLVRRVGYPR